MYYVLCTMYVYYECVLTGVQGGGSVGPGGAIGSRSVGEEVWERKWRVLFKGWIDETWLS